MNEKDRSNMAINRHQWGHLKHMKIYVQRHYGGRNEIKTAVNSPLQTLFSKNIRESDNTKYW